MPHRTARICGFSIKQTQAHGPLKVTIIAQGSGSLGFSTSPQPSSFKEVGVAEVGVAKESANLPAAASCPCVLVEEEWLQIQPSFGISVALLPLEEGPKVIQCLIRPCRVLMLTLAVKGSLYKGSLK